MGGRHSNVTSLRKPWNPACADLSSSSLLGPRSLSRNPSSFSRILPQGGPSAELSKLNSWSLHPVLTPSPAPRKTHPLDPVIANTGLRCRKNQKLGDCSRHTPAPASSSHQDPHSCWKELPNLCTTHRPPDVPGFHEGVELTGISISASSFQPSGVGCLGYRHLSPLFSALLGPPDLVAVWPHSGPRQALRQASLSLPSLFLSWKGA